MVLSTPSTPVPTASTRPHHPSPVLLRSHSLGLPTLVLSPQIHLNELLKMHVWPAPLKPLQWVPSQPTETSMTGSANLTSTGLPMSPHTPCSFSPPCLCFKQSPFPSPHWAKALLLTGLFVHGSRAHTAYSPALRRHCPMTSESETQATPSLPRWVGRLLGMDHSSHSLCMSDVLTGVVSQGRNQLSALPAALP